MRSKFRKDLGLFLTVVESVTLSLVTSQLHLISNMEWVLLNHIVSSIFSHTCFKVVLIASHFDVVNVDRERQVVPFHDAQAGILNLELFHICFKVITV